MNDELLNVMKIKDAIMKHMDSKAIYMYMYLQTEIRKFFSK